MKYIVLFPECRNVHLVKRVGMIPFYLSKLYGWDTAIACYQNEKEYPYLQTEIKGVNMEFIQKKFHNMRLDGLYYLIRNAKKIDVLQMFHIHSMRNYYWISLYKYLNPNGMVYLMLDTNYGLVNYNPFGRGLIKKIRLKILKKCKLISAETESTAHGLTEAWGVKVECVNNAFSFQSNSAVSYSDKENIICTVGRIGTYQKNTEILLNAFAEFAKENKEWKLRIIGHIEKEFEKYIEKFLIQNPELNAQITFTGEIHDRNILFEEYKRAKIFCMTSRWEGFAVSYMEALHAGCFIISSDVYCAFDVTDYQKYGLLFSVGDYIGLYNCLRRVASDETLIMRNVEDAPKYVRENYNWEKNSKHIHDLLVGN